MSRKTVWTGAAAAVLAVAATAAGTLNAQGAEESPAWRSVGKGMTSGVSGIVATGQQGDAVRALIVRDNKKPGENRMAEVTYRPDAAPSVRPLTWTGSAVPTDLEALDAVPGRPGSYVAVASEGMGYRISVTGHTVHVQSSFKLPGLGKGDNIENFALTSRGGQTVAVWGDRGQDARPGTLYAARLAFDERGKAAFGAVSHRTVRAPYPAKDVRHASDVKITDSGAVLASSASDPGDNGPFDSAVYRAGKVSVGSGGGVSLSVSEHPSVVGKFEGHKVEGIACVPGSGEGLVGTDDEAAGGAVRSAAFCGG